MPTLSFAYPYIPIQLVHVLVFEANVAAEDHPLAQYTAYSTPCFFYLLLYYPFHSSLSLSRFPRSFISSRSQSSSSFSSLFSSFFFSFLVFLIRMKPKKVYPEDQLAVVVRKKKSKATSLWNRLKNRCSWRGGGLGLGLGIGVGRRGSGSVYEAHEDSFWDTDSTSSSHTSSSENDNDSLYLSTVRKLKKCARLRDSVVLCHVLRKLSDNPSLDKQTRQSSPFPGWSLLQMTPCLSGQRSKNAIQRYMHMLLEIPADRLKQNEHPVQVALGRRRRAFAEATVVITANPSSSRQPAYVSSPIVPAREEEEDDDDEEDDNIPLGLLKEKQNSNRNNNNNNNNNHHPHHKRKYP